MLHACACSGSAPILQAVHAFSYEIQSMRHQGLTWLKARQESQRTSIVVGINSQGVYML